MKKFLPLLILVFLIGLVGVATFNLNQKQAQNQDIQNADLQQEPDVHFAKTSIQLPDFSLPDLFDENKDLSKKDLTGKYSIINFFASWCTTCRAEHEILLRLQAENIVDLYGIAWRDIDSNTKRYLDGAGNPFKQIAKDSRGLFSRITGIQAIPETLIVDPKGNVVMRFRGNLQEFSIDEIREFIQKNAQQK